jgi:ABC-type lipoprotein release transport system permease subunit
VVVNEAFVRRRFADRSPIGALVHLDQINDGETVTIVGVVSDVRFGDRRSPAWPMLYLPASQAGLWPFQLLTVRTAAEPSAMTRTIEQALGEYMRSLRVGGWQTMEAAFDETILRERLAAAMAWASAALAVGLAMVGLAGLVGFSVSRRTREIGVRMALGARRASVVWLVLRGALTLVLIGVAIGTPLALGAGRALSVLLYGIAPTNVLLLAGAALALMSAGACASAIPAWRASRVDPVTSLRSD